MEESWLVVFVLVHVGDSLSNYMQTRSLQFCVLLLGADISDCFNYGFDEEGWNTYCKKQARLCAANNLYVGVMVRFSEVFCFVKTIKT